MGIEVAGEGFTATGLMVTARNFLDVYRYQGWGGTDALPLFQQGQQFTPAAIELKQVRAARGVHGLPCTRGWGSQGWCAAWHLIQHLPCHRFITVCTPPSLSSHPRGRAPRSRPLASPSVT